MALPGTDFIRLMGYDNWLDRARDFAAKYHVGQRYGKMPYTFHLNYVEWVLRRHGVGDEEIFVAAHLHDLIEDTAVKGHHIAELFGADMATLVWRVTDEPGENREDRKRKTYPKIREDKRAIILKLADRIANMECAKKDNRGVFNMYVREYEDFRNALFDPEEKDPVVRELWHSLWELWRYS